MNVTLTLLGQMGTFLVLVLFVSKYLWGPMVQMLEERKRTIAEGLAAAEQGMKDKEEAQQQVEAEILKAKEQAKDILGQAQRRANEIVEEAKGEARVEGERLLNQAKSEIDQQMNQAREKLRGEVVTIALQGAEQVLMREVDASAHNDALSKLSAQL